MSETASFVEAAHGTLLLDKQQVQAMAVRKDEPHATDQTEVDGIGICRETGALDDLKSNLGISYGVCPQDNIKESAEVEQIAGGPAQLVLERPLDSPMPKGSAEAGSSEECLAAMRTDAPISSEEEDCEEDDEDDAVHAVHAVVDAEEGSDNDAWEEEEEATPWYGTSQSSRCSGSFWQEYDWTEEDEDQWRQESNRDYYSVLGLPAGGGSSFSVSRVRHAYHRLARKIYPLIHGRQGCKGFGRSAVPADPAARRQAEMRFWLVTEAYLVLKDPERRRIYGECGMVALRKSEACYEQSVFDQDAFEVYEVFFRGDDPEDRDFLLMNGQPRDSSESDSDGEDVEEVLAKQFGIAATDDATQDFAASRSSAASHGKARAEEPALAPELAKALDAIAPDPGAEDVGLDPKWKALIDATLAAMPPQTFSLGFEETEGDAATVASYCSAFIAEGLPTQSEASSALLQTGPKPLPGRLRLWRGATSTFRRTGPSLPPRKRQRVADT